jgi:hypothetical protein
MLKKLFVQSRLYVALLFVVGALSSQVHAQAAEKEWTLLVFLNGNNNLDGAGIEDVNEMEEVGSTENVNVVVQWASLRRRSVQRLLIQKDNDTHRVTSPIIEDMGPVDMGDWRSLVQFVAWAKEKYPAKKYFIDVWNHGGGWHLKKKGGPAVRDISWDDKTGHAITTEQLGTALAESAAIIGRKVDVYGSDACLMSMIEVAGEMSSSVGIMVGSQELEPGDGWPYAEWLSAWNSLGAEASAVSVVQELTRLYKASYTGGSQGTEEVTLSALDLSKTEQLHASLARLALAIKNQDAASKAEIRRAAWRSLAFYEADYVDLGDLLQQMHGVSTTLDLGLLGQLQEDLKSYVVANVSTPTYSRAQGVSIWWPTSKRSFDARAERYEGLNFSKSTGWGEVLASVYEATTEMVPRTGLEPACLAAPPPQDGVSTNFTTWAGVDEKRR